MQQRFGDAFRLTLVTDDPVLAANADRAGVDRIGPDLEQLGKIERQAGLSTRLSRHEIDDVATVGRALTRAKLFVRVNPINASTAAEVDAVIARGARLLMLPFFKTVDEVETFVRLVDGRASVILLVETAAAVVRLREILAVPGTGEIMVGLNDLRLELGVNNHFEVLASPVLDAIAREVHNARLPFSVGGVGRPDDRSLPIPVELVFAQFPRLGATGAWLSRSFLRDVPAGWDFGKAVAALRQRLTEWAQATPAELQRAHTRLAEHASTWGRERATST
jgi:hypothetical protein